MWEGSLKISTDFASAKLAELAPGGRKHALQHAQMTTVS